MKSAHTEAATEAFDHARSQIYVELFKPRITAMVLLTVGIGWLLGSTVAQTSPLVLLHVLIGSGLSCAGAGALNQYMERDTDLSMDRTRYRPLPTRKISPSYAFALGVSVAVGGVLYLAVLVGWVAATLNAATLVTYLFLYTPMKRLSAYSTLAGAIPGALPPMIGWAAATGGIELRAWILFAILFLWQIPHFLAIGVIYKDDYTKGGFPMLVVIDPDGGLTGRQMVLYAAALMPITLMVSAAGMAGQIYFWSAAVLGTTYIGYSVAAAISMTRASARRLMLCSVIYLPLLLAAMVIDRLGG